MHKRTFFIFALCAVLLMLTLPAMAGTMTWDDPGGSGISISFSTPDTYASCQDVTTTDTLTTTGVPSDWSVRGSVRVQYVTDSGRQDVPDGTYAVDQTGNLNLVISYPPISEWPVQSNGTAEIHVDLSLGIYDENGVRIRWVGGDPDRAPGTLGPGQDWDVFCINPPPPPPPPPGNAGCTPGYWRPGADPSTGNFSRIIVRWGEAGINPIAIFDSVFGVTGFNGNVYDGNAFDDGGSGTLLDAVYARGGGVNALARHAVAALLNANHPDVAYPLTEAQIIAGVQAAFASGDFGPFKDQLNAANNLGCPIDAGNN